MNERSNVANPLPPAGSPQARRARIKLMAVIAICAAPVIASYLTYYVIKPQGRTNYGDLIEPQRDVSALSGTDREGKAITLAALRGKWLMISVDASACAKACVDKLYAMRQVRTATGKERDRIERLMWLTDAGSPPPAVLADYEGTVFLHADRARLQAGLPALPATRLEDHLYLVDPLGNLMMRFPKEADPAKIRKDMLKLLKASRIG